MCIGVSEVKWCYKDSILLQGREKVESCLKLLAGCGSKTVYHAHQCSVMWLHTKSMMTSPSTQWRKKMKITPNSLPDSERRCGAGVALGLSKLLQLMPRSTNTSVNEK